MKKAKLYKLYEDYLQNNPQKEYVRNLHFDEWGREESSYECIDSAHIRDNQILRDENLPKHLTTEQLYKLDEKYNHELKWKILESDVTEKQIERHLGNFCESLIMKKGMRIEFLQKRKWRRVQKQMFW